MGALRSYLSGMSNAPIKEGAGSPHNPDGAARFNEANAASTVARAQPNLEMGVAAIREVVNTLKPVPGVYRMLDAQNRVLYVGKARALAKRGAHRRAIRAELRGGGRELSAARGRGF